MNTEASHNQGDTLAGIKPDRLFLGSCMSLISTAVVFGVVTSLMGDLKVEFGLTNTEAGWIGGATIWGFTISIFIFGPLCNVIGMGRLLRFSMICHLVGPLMMIFASQLGQGFAALFIGGLITSLANGTVEAVCNPLVATIYPDRKTQKLNRFHVWFPGGIVIGGLLSFGMDQLGAGFWDGMPMGAWQAKLGLVLIPTVLYGIIFTGQKFPHTERLQSGLSFGAMVKATFMRPLFVILFICMGITASLELGPGRWMSEVMGKVMSFAGANAGILVLVYGNFLMAVLRFNAGPVVKKLSPTGLLFCSAVLAGAGLTILTYVESVGAIFVAATVFYIGICYFWPTMLGVTSERVPKGGEMALALMGGWGMAVVGIITTPAMGWIVDLYGHNQLSLEETRICIVQGVELLGQIKETGGADETRGIDEAISMVNEVNEYITANGELPKVKTAKALRNIAKYAEDTEAGKKATELIEPADEYGGPFSFRWVASLSVVIIIIFGLLFINDRARGGYKAEKIVT